MADAVTVGDAEGEAGADGEEVAGEVGLGVVIASSAVRLLVRIWTLFAPTNSIWAPSPRPNRFNTA